MRPFLKLMLLGIFVTACGGGRQYGKVQLGDLEVEGTVDPEYLYLQLGQLDPTFEACYVRALRLDRSAEGVIEMKLSGLERELRDHQEIMTSANHTQSPTTQMSAPFWDAGISFIAVVMDYSAAGSG
jgi:hypothetical protein